MFYQWFVGFSDGESSFSIIPKLDTTGTKINRFSFAFTIKLHVDDKNALVYVQNTLGFGIISQEGELCKYVVSNFEEIRSLIAVFDRYNLNTTKYLDYTNFKEAFISYHSRNGLVSEQLKGKIISLKTSMNSNRTNFTMPSNHIKITTHWLLGFIEGEGSFMLCRSDLIPVFSIVLTENQKPVLVKIREFLLNNLGFDPYSKYKIENTSVMGINRQKARNNSKGSVLFIIKDIRILYNYIIPFLAKLRFLTKKGIDFLDFKLICQLVYFGVHKQDEIKPLLLKLSRSMNNYRLTNYSNKIPKQSITKQERDLLINTPPLVEYLWDGRLRRIDTKNFIHQHASCIYIVLNSTGEKGKFLTLSDTAAYVGCSLITISKYLDVEFPTTGDTSYTAEIKGVQIKRVQVYKKVYI